MNEIYEYVSSLCKRAKKASGALAVSGIEVRNSALYNMADLILKSKSDIIEANKLDLKNAASNGVSAPMLDRLSLDGKRIDSIATALESVAELPDPLGLESTYVHANGLEINKHRVPFGTVAMIYEARPNVTPDATSLCIKSGNAVILRGGKEAIETNRALVAVLGRAMEKSGLSKDCVCLIDDVTRESTSALFKMKDTVDLLIPRGSKSLIQACLAGSEIPVIETGAGNCHLYVDKGCKIDMALKVAINAKTSRPSVCNAIETLLVHEGEADRFLPLFEKEASKFNVELRCCKEAIKFTKNGIPATDEDFATEFDDYIIAVKVVKDVEEAIAHINRYGTKHSEAIITENAQNAQKFKNEVDAAAVYVNASTRFTDGGEFGLGAEIGISTQKLHARGPMGIREMTTIKYEINGNGQIR